METRGTIKRNVIIKIILMLVIMLSTIGGGVSAWKQGPPAQIGTTTVGPNSYYGEDDPPSGYGFTDEGWWLYRYDMADSQYTYCCEHMNGLRDWVIYNAYNYYDVYSGKMPVLIENIGNLAPLRDQYGIKDRLNSQKNIIVYYASVVNEPENAIVSTQSGFRKYPVQACIWYFLGQFVATHEELTDAEARIYNAAQAYDEYAKHPNGNLEVRDREPDKDNPRNDIINELNHPWVVGDKAWVIGQDIKVTKPETEGDPYIIEHKQAIIKGTGNKKGMYGQVREVTILEGTGTVRGLRLLENEPTKTEFYVDGGTPTKVAITMNNGVRTLETFYILESPDWAYGGADLQNMIVIKGHPNHNTYEIDVTTTPTLTIKKQDIDGNPVEDARFNIEVSNVKNAIIPNYSSVPYLDFKPDTIVLNDIVLGEVEITDIELRVGDTITVTIEETEAGTVPGETTKFKKIKGPIEVELKLVEGKWELVSIETDEKVKEKEFSEDSISINNNKVELAITNILPEGFELEITKRNLTEDPNEEGEPLPGVEMMIEFQNVATVGDREIIGDSCTVEGTTEDGAIYIDEITIKDTGRPISITIQEIKALDGYENPDGLIGLYVYSDGKVYMPAFAMSTLDEKLFDENKDFKTEDGGAYLNINIRNESDGSLKLNLLKTDMSGDKELEGIGFSVTISENLAEIKDSNRRNKSYCRW